MDFSTQLLAASIFSPANSSAAITAPLTPSAASYAFSSTTATASRNWDMPRARFSVFATPARRLNFVEVR